jgi:competence protein ComEA
LKSWLKLVYGLLLGLLLGGVILLIAKPATGDAIALISAPSATPSRQPSPTKTPEPILVQISGKVVSPGIYSLQQDARLQDLIDLAGGLAADADENRVNGAALLRDGDYFYIPDVDEIIPENAANSPVNLNVDLDSEYDYPLDLNTATQEALESLPGIGPTKAEDIIAYRDLHGRFTSVDELSNVSGIGEVTVESLREYLYVEP